MNTGAISSDTINPNYYSKVELVELKLVLSSKLNVLEW